MAGQANQRELTYDLPGFGRLSTTLHKESSALYKFLDSGGGEVDRLKRLDHLGMIRLAWEGAHHPRWEYIVLIFSLIDRACGLPNLGLGARTKLGNTVELSSGSELLKCWALLLNVGHLVWTFEAERVLLREIQQADTAFRGHYRAAFPDQQLQEWAEQLLTNGRTFQFFQALAFIRLRMISPCSDIEPWFTILRAYVLNSAYGEKAVRMRTIFRNIRRVAYLALDAHYTPSIVTMNLGQIFSNPRALEHIAAQQDQSENDRLGWFQRQLTRDVYLSEPALRMVAAYDQELRSRINQALVRDGLESTIDALAKGELQENIEPSSDLITVVRLPIRSDTTASVIPPIDTELYQGKVDEDIQSRQSLARAVYASAAYGTEWVLQVHSPSTHFGDRAVAYSLAFRHVLELHSKLSDSVRRFAEENPEFQLEWIQRGTFERLAAELVVAALNLVSDRSIQWEWQIGRGHLRAIFVPLEDRQYLESIAGKEREDSARATELTVFASTALIEEGPALAALTASNLTGYEGGNQCVELDGVAVTMPDADTIEILILEVKDQRVSGQAAAKRQLSTALQKLSINTIVHCEDITANTENGIACARARLRVPVPPVSTT